MKQFLLLFCLAISMAGLHAQVVYVDGDAAGTGDGSSWENAYTNLNDALLAAEAGSSVWIADGTYTTPDSTSFVIDKELTVLGGFAGGEDGADDANPDANLTILSGDVGGDDVVDVFDSLTFVDNQRVLMVMDSNENSSFTVTLDGLTFTNGGFAEEANTEVNAGGGLLVEARVMASRLNFFNNRSSVGSAISVLGDNSAGTVFEDITVARNTTGTFRSIYLSNTSDIQFNNSSFSAFGDDVSVRTGILFGTDTDGISISGSEFSDITTPERGGAFRCNDCDDVTITKTTFTNINSRNGALYFGIFDTDGLNNPDTRGADDHVLTDCIFTDCDVTTENGRGGVLTSVRANWTMNNCTITESNNDVGICSGIYMLGVDSPEAPYQYVMNNCTISDNAGGGTGTITNLDFDNSYSDVRMIGSTFSENYATGNGQGGVLYNQASGAATSAGGNIIENSVFTSNSGGFGSVLINRGSIDVDVKNSRFEGNGLGDVAAPGAEGHQGVLTYYAGLLGGLTIDSSDFIGNAVSNDGSILSGGAALYMISTVDDFNEGVPVSITNSQFRTNVNAAGTTGGGGALLMRAGLDLVIDNCDFVDNSSGDGEGGAVSAVRDGILRDTTDLTIEITRVPFSGSITRSAFVNNQAGSQGGAISTQGAVLDLTNNIFLVNRVTGAGSGGAIIFNGNSISYDPTEMDANMQFDSVGSVVLEADIVHNSFFGNAKGSGPSAAGEQIALFQPGINAGRFVEDNSMTLNMLNNFFLSDQGNSDGDIQIDAEAFTADIATLPEIIDSIGDVTINSLGGNYINGLVGEELSLGDNDVIDDELDDFDDLVELFVDLDEDTDDPLDDLDLNIGEDMGESNVLINNGVQNALVPDTDFFGNPRGERPDIGAIEADQSLVNVSEPIEESGLAISFYPNPAVDVVNIQNDEANVEKVYAMVYDQNGRLLRSTVFTAAQSSINVSQLPQGIYTLQLLIEGRFYATQIVKQ